MSPLVALIAVPTVAAVLAGMGGQIGRFVLSGLQQTAPVAAMFVFAILYFGVMTDAGLFDPIVVSAEEGCAKDDPEIFRRALAQAGVPAARGVFIDNVEENVAVARTVGMHAIFFDDEKRDLAALARELLALGIG